MRRLLPSPLLSASLFALWLVLNAPPTPGQVLLAAIVALGLPVVTLPLRPTRVRIRRPALLFRFILVVARDVLVSNAHVARALLRRKPPGGGFVTVPLELTDPAGLAALAVVTTGVPGTIWVELALDRRTLLLHVFELDDAEAFVRDYKDRYERPLREIFE